MTVVCVSMEWNARAAMHGRPALPPCEYIVPAIGSFLVMTADAVALL